MHLPWKWEKISSNPNLKLFLFLEYPNKPWNWDRISENKFGKHKQLIKKEKERKVKCCFLDHDPREEKNYRTFY